MLDVRGYGRFFKGGNVYALGDISALPFYNALQTRAYLFSVPCAYGAVGWIGNLQF